MSDELLAIFRDELEDVLGAIDVSLERLGRGDARAALEIRRAFHTLKGAAHAVGEGAVERACADAEARVAASAADPASIATIARGALPALRERLAAISGQRAPEREDAVQTLEPAPSDGDTVRIASTRVDALLAAADDLGSSLLEARSLDRLEQLRGSLDALRALVEPLATGAEPSSTEERDDARRQARGATSAAREALALAEAALREARSSSAVLDRAVGALSAELRAVRIAPFVGLAAGLERAAIEAAATLGKEVSVAFSGGEVELDRRTRDELREPLLHLVRNAVDHGIEAPAERRRGGKPSAGRIAIDAAIVAGEVQVDVTDDGAGIDVDAVLARAKQLGIADASTLAADPLSLLFEPGLSTRADAGPISGRGIGLDVVRDRVRRLHGRVHVETQRGHGTRVRMHVPLSSGALRVVHARVRHVDVLIPSTSVERVRHVAPSETITIEGRLHLPDARAPIAMARLDATLGLGDVDGAEGLSWLVVSAGMRRVALGVDALVGEIEVVARALGGRVRRVAGVSGTAVLEGGRVALLADVDALARLALPMPAAPEVAPSAVRRVLVVDDSITTRALQRALLESAGYAVVVAGDGREALDVLAEQRFDAVVTDLEMPLLDGLELLERIRALPRTRSLPVVVVTAVDRETDRRRALELGASAYVLKRDFDRERLLATLEDLL
ncbi:hybrid sensor histidine kinase/response regulator [Sandaracinus amylolyticus]|uniref:histidine kinase n=1 Tax=Sandaracinus amylolyticus TaxID=927083 RepID=A0A0F6YJD4_9BACT|nr:response regulator [Sandaracinus amylolyticus]AKF05988.1 Signal transduction histidine kinase CheA [Sandaracinus amylolyticus]